MTQVYTHIRLDNNEVFYVGVGSTKYRATSQHNRNKYWTNIVKKVGYRVEILKDGLTWEQACEEEKRLIKEYGRRDLGTGQLVNMTDGGDGVVGAVCTEQTRERRSTALRGIKQKERTAEHRLAISQSRIGKPKSKEVRNKIGVSMIGNTNSKDKVVSDTTKLKISETKKGIKKEVIECPHCNKVGGIPTMKRWHFENCKQKLV
jgi:hypothetical protein